MELTTGRVYPLALVFVFTTIFSGSVLAQQGNKDCKCRAPGGVMHDLGTVECVHIGGRPKLVTCTMSTNTPYWKDVEDVVGCPTA